MYDVRYTMLDVTQMYGGSKFRTGVHLTSYIVHSLTSYICQMSLELEQHTLAEQFEAIIQSEDKLKIREFLDDQNISDVARLVEEFPEYESSIIANMSVNRAASVFKILDLSVQK